MQTTTTRRTLSASTLVGDGVRNTAGDWYYINPGWVNLRVVKTYGICEGLETNNDLVGVGNSFLNPQPVTPAPGTTAAADDEQIGGFEPGHPDDLVGHVPVPGPDPDVPPLPGGRPPQSRTPSRSSLPAILPARRARSGAVTG